MPQPHPPARKPPAALLHRKNGQEGHDRAACGNPMPPSPPSTRNFDVTFRQRELGLGLQVTGVGLVVTQVSKSAARAGIQIGDYLFAVDGTVIPRSLERASELLKNAPRPVRLTFKGLETRGRRNTDQGMALPAPQVEGPPFLSPASPPALESIYKDKKKNIQVTRLQAKIDLGTKSANSHPRDAVLVLTNLNGEQGKVQIRAGLTAQRRRAVVAVRSATGWCAQHIIPADILIALDGALIAPPIGAKGVDALIAKCAQFAQSQRRTNNDTNTLIFARSKDARIDVLYTIALPVVRTSRNLQQWEGLPEMHDIENAQNRRERNGQQSFSWSRISRRLHHRGQAITANWGLELEEKKDALIIAQREGHGANKGDVIVLLENIPAARHTLLSFGVAADAAVVSADASGKKAVALTLVSPELFLIQRDLFYGPIPSNGTTAAGCTAEQKDEEDTYGGSLYFTAAPEMQNNERLRLAETARLLKQGIGIELHTVVPGTSRIRSRHAILHDFNNLSGIKLKPLNHTASTLIMFTDITNVDVPMGLTTCLLPDALIAASFRVSYIAERTTVYLDLSTQSPIIAHKLAEGILLLRDLRQRQNKGTSAPLLLNPSMTGPLGDSQQRRLTQIQATEADGERSFSDERHEYGGSIQWRHSGGRRLSMVRQSARIATSVATRRIAAVALTMHDQANPRQKW
eukprot:CAMPEP_0197323996 /NCGR_PEP_ID=MMETSP0891-20130614/70844_1 /TAXON_ID=44058 ORGANISM="Aureoumbra lagunensis, Strain CCMP1510" /NCGR_SAMPLE_ID=MMETSP0891 /ASSEMBLY_ACC=CAM_ASM_000534 /LENGTH=689 /DNA_ID=CAMNT_0042816741 /DNA_START=1335 /DNA_END=3401 /DNA_ORIENTATION=+